MTPDRAVQILRTDIVTFEDEGATHDEQRAAVDLGALAIEAMEAGLAFETQTSTAELEATYDEAKRAYLAAAHQEGKT